MITYLASKNQGKLAEIRRMLAQSPLDIRTYPAYDDPEEGHESYIDNALLKARALFAQLKAAGISAAVLSDDSGIELDALHGAPGVDSAIYAGADTPWPARLEKMIQDVGRNNGARRGARFICVMALIQPDGSELIVSGDVRGEIAEAARGEHGFGYDPIFFYPPLGKTFGEIPEDEKNELSHRGRAARALVKALRP